MIRISSGAHEPPEWEHPSGRRAMMSYRTATVIASGVAACVWLVERGLAGYVRAAVWLRDRQQ